MLSSSTGVLNTKMLMHMFKKLIIRPLAFDVDDFWLRTSQLWTSATLVFSHSEQTGYTLWADVIIIKKQSYCYHFERYCNIRNKSQFKWESELFPCISFEQNSRHLENMNCELGHLCGTTTSHLKWYIFNLFFTLKKISAVLI